MDSFLLKTNILKIFEVKVIIRECRDLMLPERAAKKTNAPIHPQTSENFQKPFHRNLISENPIFQNLLIFNNRLI